MLTHRNETVVRSRNHRASAVFSAVTRRPNLSSSGANPSRGEPLSSYRTPIPGSRQYKVYHLPRTDPFIYAVWALRRGMENKDLRADLRSAKHFGLESLDQIIETREEFDEDFRRDYFEWHIQYHLGDDEKRGIARFCELMTKHNLGPVFPPKFVR